MKSCMFLSGVATLCFCYPAYSQITPAAGAGVSSEVEKALEQEGSAVASAEIAAWGKNVLNEKYREFGIDFGALGYAGNI